MSDFPRFEVFLGSDGKFYWQKMLQGRFEARHGLLEADQVVMPSRSEGCPHHIEEDTLESIGFTSFEFYGS